MNEMLRERLELYRDRVRRELTAAFREEHTAHEVGVSFAIGVFVTALPTGGLGIGLFFVFSYWFTWISKPAIFASVAVLNPFVKHAVYLASFQVGAVALGTGRLVPRESTTTESVVIGVHQLVVGNLLVALGLAGAGYVVARHLTTVSRHRTAAEDGSAAGSAVLALFERRR